MTYDYIVVGGGVAGLAVAELLQRAGRNVLLVEANDWLCGEASAQQQGWFHTGALYAALPTNEYFRKLVGNLDDLLNYYSGFPRMNLVAGRNLMMTTREGWFNNSRMYYFYTSPAAGHIKLPMRLLWHLAILRATSRLSWFENIDFSRELTPQLGHLMLTLRLSRNIAKRTFEFDLGPISRVLVSRDRTMNTDLICEDLLKSFLSAGGLLKLGDKVVRIEKQRVVTEGGAYNAGHIIVTSGSGVQTLADIGVPVRIVKSPLLVVAPSLSSVNFVKMTPRITETFNHIYHACSEGDYSVIGNARYFDIHDKVNDAAVEQLIIDTASKVFGLDISGRQASFYFGYKTEVPKVGYLRNYLYQIIEAKNCVVALPGKMSLAFSLAVNVCKHFGVDPPKQLRRMTDNIPLGSIREPEHLKRFRELCVEK